jgi:hypothetical protein
VLSVAVETQHWVPPWPWCWATKYIFRIAANNVNVDSSALLACYATYIVFWHCWPVYWTSPQGTNRWNSLSFPPWRVKQFKTTWHRQAVWKPMTNVSPALYDNSQKRWPRPHGGGSLRSRGLKVLQSSRKLPDRLVRF